MIQLGVLVSGSGTNLQAVIDAIASRTLAAEIALVVSNTPDALALERARKANIPTLVVDHRAYRDRKSFDTVVVEALHGSGVDLVVLAGFMRLITDVLLDAFPMRVINVHPALLPAFPGLHAQKQAFDYGVRITGCTVHFVDGGTDTGPIIAQVAVPVLPDDDEESLRLRILAQEHALLPTVLQWVAEGRVRVRQPAGGGRAVVSVSDASGNRTA